MFFKLSGNSEEKRKKERNGLYKVYMIGWNENREKTGNCHSAPTLSPNI